MKQGPRANPLQMSTLLKRAHLHTILVAMILVGISLVTGVFSLKAFAEYNLQLMGRSLGQAVEAAVVFSDAEAASETLQHIAPGELLGLITVVDRHGVQLAQWGSVENTTGSGLQQLINHLVQPAPLLLPITHDNQVVGEIYLASNSTILSPVMAKGFAFMAASLVLAVLASLYLAKRTTRSINQPLHVLTEAAHRVRHERNFEERIPGAKIAELNELSEGLNALLAELHSWQLVQEQEKAELNYQASHDSLTGLANRNQFEAILARTYLQARQNNMRFAVLYLDADHFKQINDIKGHDAGDLVLQEVAKRLRQRVRSGDTVARFGGDEFAILLPNLNSNEDTIRIAEAITLDMRTPVRLGDGQTTHIGLSIGAAVFPDDANSPEALLKAADRAMYLVKQTGRGHWQRAHNPDTDQTGAST